MDLKEAPEFAELDKYFELSSIEKEQFFLRTSRRKMITKCSAISDFLNTLLYPGNDLVEMHDASALQESDKDEITKILSIFARYEKKSVLLSFESTDDEEYTFIKELLGVYKDALPALKGLFSRLVDSYDIPSEAKPINYLG